MRLTFFLFSLNWYGFLYAQDIHYIFQHVDQRNGLLHNMILSITQDAKGFIWILTPYGLQRYDGIRFVDYPYNPDDPNGIIRVATGDLFMDTLHHCIWITNQQLQKFDLDQKKFTTYAPDQLLGDTSFTFTRYDGPDGIAWMTGPFGLFQYDSIRHGFYPYYFYVQSLYPQRSSFFLVDHERGVTWINLLSGTIVLDEKTKKIYTASQHPLSPALFSGRNSKKILLSILKDSQRNYWWSTYQDSFFRYDSNIGKLYSYSISEIKEREGIDFNDPLTSGLTAMFEDNHHALWFGTNRVGLLHYDRASNRFSTVVGDKRTNARTQDQYNVTCLFQDREENIWIGSDKGVYIFNPYRQYFQSIHHEPTTKSLPKNDITDFLEASNGKQYVATWGGGITIYDSAWRFEKTVYFSGPLDYNFVWSFVELDDHSIWAGCQHGLIHKYNPKIDQWTTIQPPAAEGSTIRCMTKDKLGNIWMGLHNGKIIQWDRALNTFYRYNDSIPGLPNVLSPVQYIFFDAQQRCWVSTENGFKRFDTEQRIYVRNYLPEPKNTHSISASFVRGVDQLNDSTLIIGSILGGLNYFNVLTERFSHLTTHDGLPSNTIYAVRSDLSGQIWFTTDYGIYKFIPEYHKSVQYNIDPGVATSTFNLNTFYTLQDGRWLTATSTELICFQPEDSSILKRGVPHIEITGLEISGESVDVDSLLALHRPVWLNHNQNFLTIEFAAIHFSSHQQLKYYYRLSDINKDWVDAEDKYFANYTDLQPGQYVFEVRVDNGNETSGITAIAFIIAPPWWSTIWFRMLSLLVLASVVYFVLKNRIQIIRKQAELKNKIAETEMMALRSQMNPHFIFNCINSIDAMIQSNDKYRATVYLNKFALLIRNVLDSSKQNKVPLSKDMETLRLYVDLELFRHQDKFTAHITANEDLMQGDIKAPPLIIQPYVENAILHGLRHRNDQEGKLTIDVRQENEYIVYTIEDNGVGRKFSTGEKSKNVEGYGLQMSSDRIRLFNNEEIASVLITDLVADGRPSGTRVKVNLKIQ